MILCSYCDAIFNIFSVLHAHINNVNTGRFIMFSVITNILTRKLKAYLNGIVHSHRKTENVFFDN